MTYYDCLHGKFNEPMDFTYIHDEVEDVVAYRVPKDAEEALLMIDHDYSAITIIVKAADNVLCGKDLSIQINRGTGVFFLDLNTFIQRSGEYEGCVLIESDDKDFRSELLVLEK
ncbi:MAG: hypothetical protein IKK30_05990 [Clostridia bacterium]|nr:hypothetical protein [Clostridia bacterium]